MRGRSGPSGATRRPAASSMSTASACMSMSPARALPSCSSTATARWCMTGSSAASSIASHAAIASPPSTGPAMATASARTGGCGRRGRRPISLRRTLARLGVERPIVLGHSWGTLVALALALDHPEAVRGLVLLSGYYFPTGRLDVWAFAPPAIPVRGRSDALHGLAGAWADARAEADRQDVRAAAGAAPLREPASRSTSRSAPGRFGRAPRTAPSWCRAPPACRIATASSTSRSRSSQVRQTGSSTLSARPCASPAGSRTSELTLVPGVGHMIHYAAQDEIAQAVDRVSSRSGTDSAFGKMEASPGIEPGCKDLQYAAAP